MEPSRTITRSHRDCIVRAAFQHDADLDSKLRRSAAAWFWMGRLQRTSLFEAGNSLAWDPLSGGVVHLSSAAIFSGAL